MNKLICVPTISSSCTVHTSMSLGGAGVTVWGNSVEGNVFARFISRFHWANLKHYSWIKTIEWESCRVLTKRKRNFHQNLIVAPLGKVLLYYPARIDFFPVTLHFQLRFTHTFVAMDHPNQKPRYHFIEGRSSWGWTLNKKNSIITLGKNQKHDNIEKFSDTILKICVGYV